MTGEVTERAARQMRHAHACLPARISGTRAGPGATAAFTSVRDLGGKGAMLVRFEHRHLKGTAAMAAPAAARILGLLLLIRP
jgi:hypothetical protein